MVGGMGVLLRFGTEEWTISTVQLVQLVHELQTQTLTPESPMHQSVCGITHCAFSRRLCRQSTAVLYLYCKVHCKVHAVSLFRSASTPLSVWDCHVNKDAFSLVSCNLSASSIMPVDLQSQSLFCHDLPFFLVFFMTLLTLSAVAGENVRVSSEVVVEVVVINELSSISSSINS